MGIPQSTLESAKAFLADNLKPYERPSDRRVLLQPPPKSFGAYVLPDGGEARRCAQIVAMLQDYSKRVNPPCPFSIAVFGPPGSGKSHCVRELLASSDGYASEILVNLSQLTNPRQLATVFLKRLDKGDKGKTKVIFFDEFDAPLKGVPLGWLQWFLTPMQDAEFFFQGQSIEIGKAVFVFAGGTATTLEEFKKRAWLDPEAFRDRKVPDFISRLRGYIDIEGINTPQIDERIIRRALVLDHQLRKRAPDLIDRTTKALAIEPALLESLLTTAHFTHGARSLEALLDICQLTGEKTTFAKRALPPDLGLRRLHLSHGSLDKISVGLSTGIKDDQANGFIMALATALFYHGVTLAYGGDPIPSGTLEAAAAASSQLPDNLLQSGEICRVINYLPFPSYLGRSMSRPPGVEFKHLNTLSPAERKRFGVTARKWFTARPRDGREGHKDGPYSASKHIAWAISLFRMRTRMLQDIDALIVVGGTDGESWGRFSGIAEETMLAIAMGKPIYVLGGRGGAARAVGRLLGLDETLADNSACLRASKNIEFDKLLQANSECFDLPDQPMPETTDKMRSYLFESGITTRSWTWNGLDAAENRELFRRRIRLNEWGQCVALILQGLSRLHWKTPKQPTDRRPPTA